MKRLLILSLFIFWWGVVACPPSTWADTPPSVTAVSDETATLTATVTPTASPSATPVIEPTSTSTPSPSPTMTPTPTPTVTAAWPTDTPTPTVTWTATPACVDGLEPNDQPGEGAVLVINQSLNELTLAPIGDVDFFLLWAKAGRFYQLTTSVSEGLDTRLRVFDPPGNLLAENDDYLPGNPSSQVQFQAPGEGWFVVAVDSGAPTAWGCRRYSLTAVDIVAPTPTPSATPGPTVTPRPSETATATATPIPPERQPDAYEPNYDFASAANLGIGQTVSLNFNPDPPDPTTADNDFFRLYVKAGEELQMETTNLAAGLDTNLILYRENGEVIGGNDDCRRGQRQSCLTWQADYTGVAYLLVGPVGALPEALSATARTYQLTVTDVAGGGQADQSPKATPTLVYGQPLPWPVTPVPPTPTGLMPTPTAVSVGSTTTPGSSHPGSIQIRSLGTTATATPVPGEPVEVQLMVYYDENNNGAPDVSEGVAGLSVRLLDGLTNQLLGQAFTDGQGHAVISAVTTGEVRLSVPYLGYSQAVRPPGKPFELRMAALRLPSLIP